MLPAVPMSVPYAYKTLLLLVQLLLKCFLLHSNFFVLYLVLALQSNFQQIIGYMCSSSMYCMNPANLRTCNFYGSAYIHVLCMYEMEAL